MKANPRTLALLAATLLFSLLPVLPQTAQAADPWLDEDFEGGVGGYSGWSLHPTSDGHVGDGAVSNIPAGQHWGSTGHWNTSSRLSSDPQEMWMRYWVRFPVGFRVDPPSRGKLPGFAGLYSGNCRGNRPSTSGAPCWSARMSFSPIYNGDGLPTIPYDPARVTRVGWYAYLLSSGGAGKSGEILNWDPNLSTLQHGKWYCIEGRVKMNALGESNGILEGYVDGNQAFNATNLTFRRPAESHLRVKSLWFDVYYGGDATSPKSNSISFDSLAAGPERIGCNDQPGSSGTFFDDDGSVFENAIEQIAASGITVGCNPPANDRFCPDDSVTRGQMAAFLKRALGDQYPITTPEPPPSPPDFFGGRSHLEYKTALAVYASGGAPFDTYGVSYWIDDTTGDRDWLATGGNNTGNPNNGVPIQLGNIWNGGATPYVRIVAHDLRGLVAGSHDKRLNNMLATFKRFTDLGGGRRLILDILPDANVKSSDYGDDPSRFRTAFRDIATRARVLLGDNVRIAFSASRAMTSNHYSPGEWGTGGHRLYWPGSAHVDLAGVTGVASSGGSNAGLFETALGEMSNAAGPGVPLFIAAGGAPNAPSEAAQIAYVQALADLAVSNAQVVGVQWDDMLKGSLDLRVSTSSGLQSGFATASQGARNGGVDWLFSSSVDAWAAARNAAHPFDDSTSSVFADSIRWLSATGITEGCAPRRFCPDDRVTRGQMAAFLGRALKLPAPPSPIVFTDARGHLFEGAISRLAYAGITVGCNPPTNNRFCPDSFVTRGQMAAFLVRAGLTD
ncbi:MAG TPA: S-layer homology domain-containing protein [Acidimicrobiia bacterium]|nr:S-layer homology domain-containing protein [Acidimicrobiia bacterium]